MATRQKSFFDQKHPTYSNTGFNGYNDFRPHNRPAPVENLPVPKPSIAPSRQAVSKLNAFRCPDPPTNFKKRMPSGHATTSEKSNSRPSVRVPTKSFEIGQENKERQNGGNTREFPSTPAGRVPLADLIGNNEDNQDETPRASPLDAVTWEQGPMSSGETAKTPIMRKNKKRRRSLTPPHSQRTLPTKRAVQLEAFRTPQNDPAKELETRYFARSKVTTPTKPSSSAAPDFMHSSSPTTPVAGSGDSGKLRRTVSCGVAWPSGNKRRKITTDKDIQLRKSPTVVDRQGELQRINMLLDSIHNNMLEVSRNPLSQHSRDSEVLQANDQPCRAELQNEEPSGRIQHVSRSNQVQQPIFEDEAPDVLQHREPIQPKESSEFDDDDLDSALAVFADPANLSSPRRESENWHGNASDLGFQEEFPAPVPQLHPMRTDLQDPSVSLHLSQSTQRKLRLHHQSDDHNNGDDEFDDDEFDELSTDIVQIASMYDTQEPVDSARLIEAQPRSPAEKIIEELPIQPELESALPTEDVAIPPDARNAVEISDDEFGDNDFEELVNELDRATQAGEEVPTITKDKSTILRYVIVSVSESSYEIDGRAARPEKVLHVQDERTKRHRSVLLRDSWLDSPCTAGSFVHVHGDFDRFGQCVVDDAQGFLILHPDHLISATVVADSFQCTRRAVLQDRVKATNSANEPQVYGHILHEVFQEAMKANRWETEWLVDTVEAVCTQYLETLYEINIEVRLALGRLMNKIPELQAWARIFVRPQVNPEAVVQDRNGQTAVMVINKLLDVEEHVWSPRYGLKGNIDATLQVIMQDTSGDRTLTVPFEVKTGKNFSSASHRAQTALYTLLLSDRYDIEIAYGILYYLETSEISRIAGLRREIVHMIKQRNVLACYVRGREELPPMLKNPRLCGKCYAQKACFTYHRLTEDGDGRTSGLKATFMDAIKHLQPAHRDFFKRWDDLLTKEESDALRFRRELWTMLSSERERVGRCFGSLILEQGLEEAATTSKINRFQYSFIKQTNAPHFSFTDSQITIGEPIVISDESGHYALANGYVINVRRSRITVAVDRRLHNARIRSNGFHPVKNQSFTGIMRVMEASQADPFPTPQEPNEPVLYRLDKDEFSNGMATVRNNLIRLMDADLYGSHTLRKLIVEGAPPTFESDTSKAQDWISSSQATLNTDQRSAIEKVMSARNYALVLGMPGTGKTTTIAHIIHALTAQGKSILLTSYTHSAVDNILLKIRSDQIPILRLGAASKIHPSVRAFADLASNPKLSFEELERSYSAQIVATTCLGINHPIFRSRIFDYCIVDEASQITLPVCLGPIQLAKKFVLAGDHFQLPPLVSNKEAAQGGLDISLFKLLSDTQPHSVVTLQHQYRMCADIMSLSNTLIYSGRLICGTPSVASATMHIPHLAALKYAHHYSSPASLPPTQNSFCPSPTQGSCWLASALTPAARVVFVDTDGLGLAGREITKGARITNPLEVTLTMQIVQALLSTGVDAADVGVITLYRSQLALLRHELRRVKAHFTTAARSQTTDAAAENTGQGEDSKVDATAGEVEMHTADRFQGRDKEAVVLSLVRSNEAGNVGDLLLDWRRVNVALTRARTKLIIIGSAGTVARGSELLGQFVGMCRDNGWVWKLKEGEVGGHFFEEGGTQVTQVGDIEGDQKTRGGEATATKEDGERGRKKKRKRELKVWVDGDEENMKPDSDVEIGGSGKSPKKSQSSQGTKGDRGSGSLRKPGKVGKIGGERVTKGRPVLGDVINEALG